MGNLLKEKTKYFHLRQEALLEALAKRGIPKDEALAMINVEVRVGNGGNAQKFGEVFPMLNHDELKALKDVLGTGKEARGIGKYFIEWAKKHNLLNKEYGVTYADVKAREVAYKLAFRAMYNNQKV